MFPKKYIFILIFIAAVLLCAAHKANATTEFISTIRATGGDYSLLSTWEAAVQCDLTASTTVVYSGTGAGGISAGATLELFRNEEYQNITALKIATTSSQLLVQTFTGSYKVLQNGDQWRVASSTANMWTVSSAGLGDSAIAVAECYNDWPSTGLVDKVAISGWTTSAANYVKIYAPESERHNGKAKSGANYTGFAMKAPAGNFQYIFEVYVRVLIDGIIADLGTGQANTGYFLSSTATDSLICEHCIAINGAGNSETHGFSNRSSTIYMKCSNCLAQDIGGGTVNSKGFYARGFGKAYYYNCTSVDSVYGFYGNGENDYIYCKNCLSHSNSVADFYWYLTNDAKVSYSASSDATADDAGGTGNRINQIFTFVDEANNDFHLSSSDSGAKNQGTDLSGDGSYPITDDIDYQTRPYGGIWDIGADETPFSAFKFNGGTFKIRGSVKFE